MKIGIPRGLLYSRYGEMWQVLLSAVGAEPVVSPVTNRATLDAGCKLAVDETCLSVKAYLGHVGWLAERCDAVLVPRFVSVCRGERECVKLWGIHDIARNALPEARIIGYSVDVDGASGAKATHSAALYGLARELEATPIAAVHAVARALLAYVGERAADTIAAPMATSSAETGAGFSEGGDLSTTHERPRVLVVGHGYNLHDKMIGAPIVRSLRELGCEVVESESTPGRTARKLARRVSPRLQWTNNLHLLGAVEYWREKVDGIVFLVTFPCGPDSLVTELVVRTLPDKPMVTLVLDEHSGEGGLVTRLESFVDILSMQRAAATSACAFTADSQRAVG